MFTEDEYLMWLTSVQGIPTLKKLELLKFFGTAQELWNTSYSRLISSRILSETQVYAVDSEKDESKLNRSINELHEKNIKFVSINGDRYPALLKEIADPPVGFYMMGEMPDDSLDKVSIVGSRMCSSYGVSQAHRFSKELAEEGIVVVSGLAVGIDAKAHQAAVNAGGKTIAVIGCGLDMDYPSANRELKKEIIKNGCIISEYPLGTKPFPVNFPIRNRIISGLCKATIVIEAAMKSGTLITAGLALDQGRELLAMPGNITSRLSQGCNKLIKECAYPMTEVQDVLNLIGFEYTKTEHIKQENCKNKNIELAPNEKLIYDCINFEPVTTDELVEKTQLKVQDLQHILTMLEIKGLIQRISGQKYILI